MKNAGLTIAALLFFVAALKAQTDTTSTGAYNQQRSNQYRTDSTQQQGVQQSEIQKTETENEQQRTQRSQGTVSGSHPYDTAGAQALPEINSSVNDSTAYDNKTGTTGMSSTEPTGDGSGNSSGITEAGTSGTTGTGPTGASTSGAPGRPRYEGDSAAAQERAALSAKPSKTGTKKTKAQKRQRDQE
jgi:hypothetical protein